ncbi:MAG: hypothetical protein ACOYMA_01540 [Bacteroidia bacterium]
MEKVIISYSLFTPKKLHEDVRVWDPYISETRYWYNIPALIAVNLMVYPNAAIWIYLPEELIKHPLYEMLEKLSEKFEALKLKFLSYNYQNTEPTLWRYKPVFDKLSEIVLCRDLDSVPNEMEIRATQYFIEEPSFYIQTLRTHKNHIFPITTILAGLSAYRPTKISTISNLNFNDYYFQTKSDLYGLDQKSIIEIFTKDEVWTKKHFMDCPINSKKHKVGKPLIKCKSIDEKKYRKKENINHISPDLLKILNEVTTWGGEPVDFRGQKLELLLSQNNLITFKLKKVLMDCSTFTKNFYLNGNVESALHIG